MPTEIHFKVQQSRVAELLELLRKTLDSDARLIQTHISYVLLHGDRAWKIKKAIKLPFLDFTTLSARKYYCRREYTLNREFADQLYLDVCPLYCDGGGVVNCDGRGVVWDYYIEMRRFDQSALMSNMINERVDGRARVGARHIHLLAGIIGRFHNTRPQIVQNKEDSVAHSIQEMVDNFNALEGVQATPDQRALLAQTKREALAEIESLRPLLGKRIDSGKVRLCHGDLHLGNIVWWNDRPVLFDRIEFNLAFAEIDVVKDLAFLYMDLIAHHRAELATALISDWVRETGDYQGLVLLRPYANYRAMVRAKIATIEAGRSTDESGAQAAIWQRLQIAHRFLPPARHYLILMFGVTGVGKSRHALKLASLLDALIVRSDVVRKQLLDLPVEKTLDRDLLDKVYSEKSTENTYRRMLAIVRLWLERRYSVVVDSTFIQRRHRKLFLDLARAKGVPWVIASPQCREAELHRRLERRRSTRDSSASLSDGDESVLADQLDRIEALDGEEERHQIKLSPAQALSVEDIRSIAKVR